MSECFRCNQPDKNHPIVTVTWECKTPIHEVKEPLPSSLGPDSLVGYGRIGAIRSMDTYAVEFRDLLPEIQKALLESGKWEKLKRWLEEDGEKYEVQDEKFVEVLKKMEELDKP